MEWRKGEKERGRRERGVINYTGELVLFVLDTVVLHHQTVLESTASAFDSICIPPHRAALLPKLALLCIWKTFL